MWNRAIVRPYCNKSIAQVIRSSPRQFVNTAFAMSKQQEPRVIESIDVPGDGMKWVKLRKINWEDQTGRKVSRQDVYRPPGRAQ